MAIQNSGDLPCISVVVPTFKRAEMVRAAITSVIHQRVDAGTHEVIVVDSSSDDEVVAVVRELQRSSPCALRLYTKRPEGPGPSRNLGVREARAEIIAFMDSDCVAAPGWLDAGLRHFEDEAVGLVQGRTLPDPEGKLGVFVWYLSVEREGMIYEGANIFYRKRAFNGAGGFDRDWTPNAVSPMGGEDVELAWRVKRNGWRSCFAEDAVVYHEVVPISPLRWLVSKRLYMWPRIVRNVPELRRSFYARYFFDRVHAALTLGIGGTVVAPFAPVALLLWLPYALLRGSEPTKTLAGALRPVRVAVYLPRDLLSLGVLLLGSIRFRRLLI